MTDRWFKWFRLWILFIALWAATLITGLIADFKPLIAVALVLSLIALVFSFLMLKETREAMQRGEE